MASISIAAEAEDQLTLLRALRAKLAWSLDNADCTRDVEPLARRLAVIGEQIADLLALKNTSETCAADAIAERRRARLAKHKPVTSEHDMPAAQRRATRRKSS